MSSGASTQYEYDTNGWISRLRHFDAVNALISDTSYVRDRMGNILNQAVSVGSSTNASTMLKAGTTTYTYDSGTNRLANIRVGSASGAIESTFTHDFEGRLTNQTGVGAKTLSWDSRNRVSSIAMPNTTTATMSYDAADQRTGKSGGAQGGYLTMSLEGSHVEAVYGGGGTLTEKYLRGSTTDELVAGFILEGTNKPLPKLYHQDHIGSISAITDHKGGVTQSFTYSAFGQVQRAAGGGLARLKYTGRDDDETGLYYYRARYYDPRIGRFISEDPMGYGAGDVNFYAYVSNNPVNGNDPSGMIDVTYSARSLTPSLSNTPLFGTNYFVQGSNGASYPMGAGVIQRTVMEGRPFDTVLGPQETRGIIDWGRDHIRNTRLDGASGTPSFAELITQSPTGQAWDTKPYLPRNYVYVLNGKAELNDYVGNTIWGAGLNALGTSQRTALLGAQGQAMWATGRADDPRDQEAIRYGYSLPTSSYRGGATLNWESSGASGAWGSSGASGSWDSSAAAGGYLLYPNMSNTNQSRGVYSK
jgi:RHS repeat-associated protein